MFNDVKKFHEMVQQPIGTSPHLLSDSDMLRRLRLIEEEKTEMLTNHGQGNIIEVIDGIVDTIYVLLGTAVEMGIDFEAHWNEVQRANMSKADGHMDPSGKWIKPDNWSPPNHAQFLECFYCGDEAGFSERDTDRPQATNLLVPACIECRGK